MRAFIITLFFYITFCNVNSLKSAHNTKFIEGFVRPPPRSVSDDGKNYTRWFTQNLDHFDVENLNTWQQKYFVNDEFLDQTKRNVAFLFIGGESRGDDSWMTTGAWTDYAKANNAILFELEHRFYGESQPTEDLSVENLKYLTSQQALADIAVFVNAANAEYNLSPDVKWVAFGGSYAGSLAAWLRLKYPHLIHAAVSSSGPLLAISNFEDFFQVVGDDILNFSEDCYNSFEKGMNQIEDLIQDADGRNTVTNLFNLCSPLEDATDNDISMFFYNLAPAFIGATLSNVKLNLACDTLTDTSKGEEIDRIADLVYSEDCMDYNYTTFVTRILSYTTSDPWTSHRQWAFQTCNEFGFYQTTDKEPHVFGHHIPLSYYIQWCIDAFGDQFNESYVDAAVARTNTFYGGMDIKVTNVVFVHGSADAWHPLGITKTRNPDSPAIFINGTNHCADMYSPSEDDPPALTEARKQIEQLIETWLNQ